MSLVRFSFLVAVLSSALIACGTPPCKAGDPGCTAAGGGQGGGGGGCFADEDCPDPRFFFCNTTTSMCEPSCRTKGNCTVAERGAEFKLDYCDTGLGCQCDEGKCVGSLCGSDTDCGSQVCRNGACVAPPAASTVTKCVILPDYATLKANTTQKFAVEGFDSTGQPVVLNAGVTWSAGASGGSVVGTGNTAVFTAGGTAMAVGAGATATIGTVTCSAQVETLSDAVGATELAVVVTDELSGRPVNGADVLVSDSATGAPIGNVTPTGTNGYVKLTGITGTEINVTVFSTKYNYLTIANYDTTGGASRFLSFVLRRNQNDKYGGQKGTFTGVPMSSNVHAALSGMSIAGSITDLSLSQLLGQTVPTRVKIGMAVDQMNVPLPAGVYLGFSDQPIKTDVAAQGLAGVCTSAKGGETAIAAGTCGTRTAWGLSGDVPLGDLPIDAFAGGVDNIKFDVVLARVIPIFRKFNSSLVRDVEFSLNDTPLDANGFPTFANAPQSHFTSQNMAFSPPDSIPLAFNFVNRVPDLPKFRNSYVDGVVLLGGANVPGRGVVPLGLGVAVNTDGDAKTDKPMDLSGPGLVQLRMAPTHHGIEGTEYGILAAGVSFKAFTDASAGIALSGIFGHPEGNKLAFDPTGATPYALPGPFPTMPEQAKYNFSSTTNGGLNARTFKISNFSMTSPANPTTVVRVAFTDNFEHRWVVMADPGKIAGSGFTLPTPPGGTADRTFANGNAGGPRSTMLVQTIRLSETPAVASPPLMAYRTLVEANGTNSDRMTDFTTAFSFIDYSRPTIEWKTPMAAGTIMHGTNAVVTVTHFKVGTVAGTDDGYVKVTFTGGTGCTEASGTTDSSMGKGEISVPIPAGCTGMVTATAKLVDTAGGDLVPSISSPISITVN